METKQQWQEQSCHEEPQYKLSKEEQRCLDTISSLEQFYNFKNHDSLVMISLSKPLSLAFFNSNKVEISSLFGGDNKEEMEDERNRHFAKKYSFERLCEKFVYPKGNSNTFRRIVRNKLKTEYIESHTTRKQVWLLASGAKYNIKIYKGMYKSLLQMNNYPESYTRAIDLDLNRTAIDSPQGLTAMRNMLVAFSRKNPYIGYCQGLNFIAHFILTMQFTEQEGFWLLSQLLQTIIPMEYYTNMIGVVTDQRVFLQILRQRNPRISNKFKEVGLDPSIFTIQWFVCLFTSSVPFYLAQIIWDRLIIQGTSALLKTGIILLEECQAQIMKAPDFPDIIILMEQRCKRLSMSELQFNLRYEKVYICRRVLQLARDIYRQLYVKEKLAEKLGKIKNQRKISIMNCNRQWPICLQVLQKNKKDREECETWTFKRSAPVTVRMDYLDSLQQAKLRTGAPDSPLTKRTVSLRNQPVDPCELVIGRIAHICTVKIPIQTQVVKPESQLPQLQKGISKSDFQVLQQEHEQPDILAFSFFDSSAKLNHKTAERLNRAKSVHFYQKFVFNNKQLGEIIANDSLLERSIP